VTIETLARMATDPGERQELFAMSRPDNRDLMRQKVTDGMHDGVWMACCKVV
jgi:hypothetical protein